MTLRQVRTARDRKVAITEGTYAAYAGARRVRCYRPESAPDDLPVVLYLHGGDFTSGNIEQSEPTATQLAAHLDVLVVAPDYTLADEHPFPVAVEDAYAAACWALAHALPHGRQARCIAVLGEEAGGNLAAVVALMAKDRQAPSLAAQVLIAPFLDAGMAARSMHAAATTRHPSPVSGCVSAYLRYLPSPSDRLHPYAAPGLCTRLSGVAPALIITVADHPSKDEANRYGSALIASGVTTQVSCVHALHDPARRWSRQTWNDIAGFLGPRLETVAR